MDHNFPQHKKRKSLYLVSKCNLISGDWIDDERNGKGTYFFKSGDKYIGDFVDGLRHGHGIYYHQYKMNTNLFNIQNKQNLHL